MVVKMGAVGYMATICSSTFSAPPIWFSQSWAKAIFKGVPKLP